MTELAMARWRWQLVYDAVTVLAADPETQTRWVSDAHVDELGLEIDNAFAVLSTLQQVDGVELTTEALAVLGRIDATLTSMSGVANAGLWTANALVYSDRWAELRDLARATLALLPPPPTTTPTPDPESAERPNGTGSH